MFEMDLLAEQYQEQYHDFGAEVYQEREWDRRRGRERERIERYDYDHGRSGQEIERYDYGHGRSDRREDRERDRERKGRRGRDRDRDRERSERRDRRSRSKDRERDRDRDRNRERDRDRDRDRERGRDRREDRDRMWLHGDDRGPNSAYDSQGEIFDLRGQSYSFSGINSDKSGDYQNDSYKNQAPNNTIMIRGLAQHITENDIRTDILQCGMMPKDIRLIRKKDTGASRGFAFVEFNTLQEAIQWMEMKQGVLMLQDQYRAIMQYSIPKEGHGDRGAGKAAQDWYCIKCGAHNFKRRDSCFKCNASRQETEQGVEASEEISPCPTSTVLLRNLDVLSTEDSVLQVIQTLTSLPIRSIRIGRDPLTNTSRGICFIEMNSVVDAMYLHNQLSVSPPTIDGRKVLVSYSKLPQVSSNSSMVASTALAAAQWSNQSSTGQCSKEDITRLAEYSATLYATTPEEQIAYQQYYEEYYTQQICQGQPLSSLSSTTQTDSVNAAAAVAQSAIQQVQAAKEYKKQQQHLQDQIIAQMQEQQKLAQMKPEEKLAYEAHKFAQQSGQSQATISAAAAVTSTTAGTSLQAAAATATISAPATTNTAVQAHIQAPPQPQLQANAELAKYSTPDVSTYQYDETSGYYYDPQTGLYYDASSQYYYNAQTGQFMYWDGEKQTYLSAPVEDQQSSQSKDDKKVKDKDKQDKVKVAKKIAKDMERWAKTLNQRKEAAKQNMSCAVPCPIPTKSTGAADAGFAVLEKKDKLSLVEKQSQVFQAMQRKDVDEKKVLPIIAANKPGAKSPGLVAAYGGGSDSDEEASSEDPSDIKHTDWNKMACLLCKRQFPSKEALIRHQQKSELHKQNLEQDRQTRMNNPDLDEAEKRERGQNYRDRAKERRQKYGEPEPAHPNRLKEKYLKAREEAAATSYEEPHKQGIGSDNIGNQLLQKMGWSEGMGLGKSNQGRTTIIEAERRAQSVGLGMKGGNYGAVPGDSYKDCVKKMMYARYQELTEQEKTTS